MFVYIQPSVWFGISFSYVDLVNTCPVPIFPSNSKHSDQWKWMLGFLLLFQSNSIMIPGWLAPLLMVHNNR